MRLSRQAFDVESRYFHTEKRLQPVAGIASWFAEFKARNFIGLDIIFQLLKLLFIHDICCHVGG
jgi:hypothetical protein